MTKTAAGADAIRLQVGVFGQFVGKVVVAEDDSNAEFEDGGSDPGPSLRLWVDHKKWSLKGVIQ